MNAAASRSPISGVIGDGLNTTVLPAASAGPILRLARLSGKFHGVITPTTPTGSSTRVHERRVVARERGARQPVRLAGVQLEVARRAATPRFVASASGLPSSAHHLGRDRRRPARRAGRAAAVSSSARRVGVVRRHDEAASLAASTAARDVGGRRLSGAIDTTSAPVGRDCGARTSAPSAAGEQCAADPVDSTVDRACGAVVVAASVGRRRRRLPVVPLREVDRLAEVLEHRRDAGLAAGDVLAWCGRRDTPMPPTTSPSTSIGHPPTKIENRPPCMFMMPNASWPGWALV